MTGERRTFLFMPESAYGPTNNCIGIGNELLKRGHRVVFAAERSWEGRLSALGFEEDLVDLAPAPEEDVSRTPGSSGRTTSRRSRPSSARAPPSSSRR